MARIAFFTESLPPQSDIIAEFSYDLIRSLADQQHEIRVFSTYRDGQELPPAHPRIEVLRPFQSWSWLEIPRILPLLIDFRPELIHIVQPRAEALKGFTNAMSALPSLKLVLGQPVFVTSFYDLRRSLLKTHNLLLRASDAVTVSNSSQQELLSSVLTRAAHIVPIPSSTASGEAQADSNLEQFVDDGQVIFVPGDVGDHENIEELFSTLNSVLGKHPDSKVVFGGGWGSVHAKLRHVLLRPFAERGSRILITGQLTPNEERLCLRKAHVVFTASLPPESMSLARIFREALKEAAPLLMTLSQSSLDGLNWRNGESALLTTDLPGDWLEALTEALSPTSEIAKVRENLPEFSRIEAIDLPGNVMSRLYAELLARRARR